MKALTIWQPWAGSIAVGIKENETRSWWTNYRGEIAIHSALKSVQYIWNDRYMTSDSRKVICRRMNLPNFLIFAEFFDITSVFPMGCVLATATLVDCIRITPEYIATLTQDEIALGDYSLGRYAWKLKNIRMLEEPISVKGKQGLWDWEPDKKLKYKN